MEDLPTMDFENPIARHRILITGGPGFGITTTVQRLAARGHTTIKEAARFVIKREMAAGDSQVLPWKNRRAFDDAIAEVKVQDYLDAPQDEVVFFDRGLPDFVGWSRYYDKDYARFIPMMESYPYHQVVFFTVPWEEIYEQNDERPLTFEQASDVHHILVSAYQELGFDIQFMRKVGPEDRANDILSALEL